jgi:hypothetical protein
MRKRSRLVAKVNQDVEFKLNGRPAAAAR